MSHAMLILSAALVCVVPCYPAAYHQQSTQFAQTLIEFGTETRTTDPHVGRCSEHVHCTVLAPGLGHIVHLYTLPHTSMRSKGGIG